MKNKLLSKFTVLLLMIVFFIFNLYGNRAISNEMVFVEGGTFTSLDYDWEDEEYVSTDYIITLSSFYMSKYEITQSEWETVMTGNNNGISANPSITKDNIDMDNPVDFVSWFDSIVFCNRKSIMENLTPVYVKHGQTDPDLWGNIPVSRDEANDLEWIYLTINLSANGYRLPTDMEWEWAARGGLIAQQSGTFYTPYAGSDTVDTVAWYRDNSQNRTHPVGSKSPNELGLFDMTGNLWEWCWDWLSLDLSGTHTNPLGANKGLTRILRGGSWYQKSTDCIIPFRVSGYPESRGSDLGFRLVRNQ